MPAPSCQFPPIDVHFPGVNSAISDTPVGSSTSPSSLFADDEQLMRTVHFTHDGKSITFEIVNKRLSSMEVDSSIDEVDLIPDNIFKRVSKSIFRSCLSFKTRRAKAKSPGTFGTT